ncbi:MAG TPA: hypothetical protein VJZ71_20930 [Phycisphaerae bacterium]|nr:hypothetical protein [Phycisphaerae bacterium]
MKEKTVLRKLRSVRSSLKKVRTRLKLNPRDDVLFENAVAELDKLCRGISGESRRQSAKGQIGKLLNSLGTIAKFVKDCFFE